MSAAQFALEIDRDLERTDDQFRTEIAVIALEALKRVVMRTPVDNGLLINNWFVEFGGAGIQTTTETDMNGAGSIGRAGGLVLSYTGLEAFPIISLYNNLPYAARIEGGHSRIKQPNGMVAVTVAELQASL